MPNPLVSVVVPIYKVEQYLERCLDSIVAQVYRPIEVVLVNDGSPDGCGDIIRRYEALYPFMRSIWQENCGLGAARNVGIASATGKYLILTDSDDYIEPDFISGMVEIAEQEHADVTVCNFYFNFSNGVKIPFPLLTQQKNMSGEEAAQNSLNLLRLPGFAWNKLYRRELFTDYEISFPSIYYEDIATISRVLARARIVAITRKPYYHYCLRRTGIVGNFGMKNIVDYLKAVDIIRHFIWDEKMWKAWGIPYRKFLWTVKIQLILAIIFQKNSIPVKKRRRLIQQIHRQIRDLGLAPDVHKPEANQTPPKLQETE